MLAGFATNSKQYDHGIKKNVIHAPRVSKAIPSDFWDQNAQHHWLL
jgi:hypothetical protein